jgi:hypothetical protein
VARRSARRDRRLTRTEAEQLVESLAGVHSHFWRAPLRRLHGNWLRSSSEYLRVIDAAINGPARMLAGFERAREVIPRDVYAQRHTFHAKLVRSQLLNLDPPIRPGSEVK